MAIGEYRDGDNEADQGGPRAYESGHLAGVGDPIGADEIADQTLGVDGGGIQEESC